MNDVVEVRHLNRLRGHGGTGCIGIDGGRHRLALAGLSVYVDNVSHGGLQSAYERLPVVLLEETAKR